MRQLKDNFGRVHDYLRVSVTDKCNLKCFYCNPSEHFQKLKKEEILSYSELLRLIQLFVKNLGFQKIRITGGEPLSRKGIFDFFEQLFILKKEYPFYLGISTNGILLKGNTGLLKQCGVNGLNISLDTLDKEKFFTITGGNDFEDVTASIKETSLAGFDKVKVNTVVMRGVNDYELDDFVSFASDHNLNLRFIEYMPFTNNSWNKDAFISFAEMKQRIEKNFSLEYISDSKGITKDFAVKGTNAVISFITSVSEHFCGTCNRLRITSEGKMKLCLFSDKDGTFDLKELLRSTGDDNKIAEMIEQKISGKFYKHPELDELKCLKDNFMIGIGG